METTHIQTWLSEIRPAFGSGDGDIHRDPVVCLVFCWPDDSCYITSDARPPMILSKMTVVSPVTSS